MRTRLKMTSVFANLRHSLEWGRGAPSFPLSVSPIHLPQLNVPGSGEGQTRVDRCVYDEVRAEHPRTRSRGREIAGDDERARGSAEEMRPAFGKDAGSLNSSARVYPVPSGAGFDLRRSVRGPEPTG